MNEPPIVSVPAPHLPGKPAGVAVQSKWSGLLNNRPGILVLLFFVTGILGLPLLWLSDSFSRTEKIVWSIVVTLYTLLLLGATLAIGWWVYAQISQLINL